MPRAEARSTEWITSGDRLALMREGILVISSSSHRATRSLDIASCVHDALDRAAAQVGADVEIALLRETPRFIAPIRCVGHMEREPGRLQLRIVAGAEQHVDDILVEEDAYAVVVYATACTPSSFELGERCDCPYHVDLQQPLGDREVYDGAFGNPVPYRNVYAELEAAGAA